MAGSRCRCVVAAVAVVWSMSAISAAYTRHKGCPSSDCRLNFLAVFLALTSCCCQSQVFVAVAIVVDIVVAAVAVSAAAAAVVAVVSTSPGFVCDFSLEANDHPA